MLQSNLAKRSECELPVRKDLAAAFGGVLPPNPSTRLIDPLVPSTP